MRIHTVALVLLGACSSESDTAAFRADTADSSRAGTAQIGEADFESRWTPESDSEIEARARDIDEELVRREGPRWEGEYYFGDGTGQNVVLKLAQSAGFVVESRGCVEVHDRNHGPVRVIDGVIELDFAWKNERDGLRGFPARLIPVRWGERSYLLTERQFDDFCNAFDHGREPRKESWGFFFMRMGDERRAAPGKPPVPEGYERLLLDAPIEASVRHTERFEICVDADGREIVTRVTIDKGWSDGVATDLEFFVGDGRAGSRMTIEDTAEHTARGILDKRGESSPAPPIGARATTRP